jgi:hypothetical protein
VRDLTESGMVGHHVDLCDPDGNRIRVVAAQLLRA